MADAFTCKVDLFGKAPKRLQLFGEKGKKSESAQHVIEFPGGAIELSRTEDGNYWAHIIVNRSHTVDDSKGRLSATGEVIRSRVDWDGRSAVGIPEIADHGEITQIAVLIKPTKG